MTLSYSCVLEIQTVTLSRSCLAVSYRLSIHLCTGARMWLEVGETEDNIVWWTQRIRNRDVVGVKERQMTLWWTQYIKSNNMADAVFKEPGCGWR